MLRQWLRDKRDQDTGDDVRDDLKTLYSHPQWFIDKLLKKWGKKHAEEILEWNNCAPKQYARLRVPLAACQKEIENKILKPAEQFGNNVVEIISMSKFLSTDLFTTGALYIQQSWSIDVMRQLPLKNGNRVLDMCAAPGGKSIAAADIADVSIVAVESNSQRIPSLYENITRCSMHQIFPVVMDDRLAPDTFGNESFDAIILDAPCSSLGVIQRHPSIRWRVQPELCEYLAALQKELLDAAIKCVKKEGYVLYSVCTFLPEETIENKLYAEKTGKIRCIKEKLRTPGENGYDGGYYALLQKK